LSRHWIIGTGALGSDVRTYTVPPSITLTPGTGPTYAPVTSTSTKTGTTSQSATSSSLPGPTIGGIGAGVCIAVIATIVAILVYNYKLRGRAIAMPEGPATLANGLELIIT